MNLKAVKRRPYYTQPTSIADGGRIGKPPPGNRSSIVRRRLMMKIKTKSQIAKFCPIQSWKGYAVNCPNDPLYYWQLLWCVVCQFYKSYIMLKPNVFNFAVSSPFLKNRPTVTACPCQFSFEEPKRIPPRKIGP